jgi:hypothetical protein
MSVPEESLSWVESGSVYCSPGSHIPETPASKGGPRMLFLPKHALQLVLARLSVPSDVCAADRVSHAWRIANADGGWGALAKSFGLPENFRSSSWRETLLSVVKPVYVRLRPMLSLQSLKDNVHRQAGDNSRIDYVEKKLQASPDRDDYRAQIKWHQAEKAKAIELLAACERENWGPLPEPGKALLESFSETPLLSTDIVGLICTLGYMRNAPLAKHYKYCQAHSSYLLAPKKEWCGRHEFLHLGTAVLGGGDTEWWIYGIVSGPGVTCPLAPANYTGKGGERGEFGPKQLFKVGAVVVFSLWNHGGCEWDKAHVPPHWGCEYTKQDLGCSPRFGTSEYDAWVRECVENPIRVSMDAPPCAWPSVMAFLDDVGTAWQYSIPGKICNEGITPEKAKKLIEQELSERPCNDICILSVM